MDRDHGNEDYDGNEDSVHEGDRFGKPEDEDMTDGSNDPHETASDSRCSVDPNDSEDLHASSWNNDQRCLKARIWH